MGWHAGWKNWVFITAVKAAGHGSGYDRWWEHLWRIVVWSIEGRICNCAKHLLRGAKGMHPSYSAGHYCLYTIEVWKSFGLEGLCIFVFLGIYKWSDYAGNNILTMTYSFQADIWLRSILRPFSSSQLKPDNILSPATTL